MNGRVLKCPEALTLHTGVNVVAAEFRVSRILALSASYRPGHCAKVRELWRGCVPLNVTK